MQRTCPGIYHQIRCQSVSQQFPDQVQLTEKPLPGRAAESHRAEGAEQVAPAGELVGKGTEPGNAIAGDADGRHNVGGEYCENVSEPLVRQNKRQLKHAGRIVRVRQ